MRIGGHYSVDNCTVLYCVVLWCDALSSTIVDGVVGVGVREYSVIYMVESSSLYSPIIEGKYVQMSKTEIGALMTAT